MERSRRIATMAELQAALQAAFNAINRDFYNDELEKCIITVKESARRDAFGWIEVSKQWVQNGKERHEINICADFIGERTVEETIGVLMHEMAHLYNIQHDIKDTSRSGIYHNIDFARTAQAHGLNVKQIDKVGWAWTEPTQQTKQWIKLNINIKSIGLYKQVAHKNSPNRQKTKQSSRKYVCPSCGLIARLTKDARIACIDCGKEMFFES